MKLSRRAFFRLGLLGIIGLSGGVGFANSRSLKKENIMVLLERLPARLEGLKIGQISDVHAGPLVPRDLIKQGVDLIMAEKPDLVVLTGDFVSGATKFLWTSYGGFRPKDLDNLLKEFSRLKAPLGVFAVLGNHDFWTGKEVAEKIARSMSGIGIKVLRNESVRLTRDGSSIYLSGVDDYWENSFNLKKAVKTVPGDQCHIHLSHNPDVNDDINVNEYPVDLILAGHTHGGQIVLPFLGAPYLPSPFGQKYRAGLIRDGSRQTYVNRGLGVFFVPVRLNCSPEVTILTLQSGEVSSFLRADRPRPA